MAQDAPEFFCQPRRDKEGMLIAVNVLRELASCASLHSEIQPPTPPPKLP